MIDRLRLTRMTQVHNDTIFLVILIDSIINLFLLRFAFCIFLFIFYNIIFCPLYFAFEIARNLYKAHSFIHSFIFGTLFRAIQSIWNKDSL